MPGDGRLLTNSPFPYGRAGGRGLRQTPDSVIACWYSLKGGARDPLHSITMIFP